MFSNTNHDLVQLNRLPAGQATCPVYLLHDRQLRDLYRDWTGIDSLPLADAGAAIELRSRARLKRDLARTCRRGTRWRLRRAARQLPDPSQAPSKVLAVIRAGNDPGNSFEDS